MNTNVNFEIAKLLLDKGYDRIVSSAYHKATSKLIFTNWETVETNDDILIPAAFNLKEDSYLISAPTIAEVVMWLYEKHGIWIDVSLNQFSKPKDLQWMYSIVFTQDCTYSHSPKSYNSPTEAYSSAIEYTLKNLIK